MFTGIVQAKCRVEVLNRLEGLTVLRCQLPPELTASLEKGGSIAVNGVCLTVKAFSRDGQVDFDVMQETLRLTNLQWLESGDQVNIERSLTFGHEIGGHVLSGHIDGLVAVERIEKTENNQSIFFSYEAPFASYLFLKGFVALNGCSLTIATMDADKRVFSVAYIPETLERTNHGGLQTGDKVNLEIDRQTQVIVDTVERILAERESRK